MDEDEFEHCAVGPGTVVQVRDGEAFADGVVVDFHPIGGRYQVQTNDNRMLGG